MERTVIEKIKPTKTFSRYYLDRLLIFIIYFIIDSIIITILSSVIYLYMIPRFMYSIVKVSKYDLPVEEIIGHIAMINLVPGSMFYTLTYPNY